MEPHKVYLQLRKATLDAIDDVPKRIVRGSARHVESQVLRSSDGGGRQRATLLDDLNVDGQVMAGQVAYLFGGAIDLLQTASTRANSVNAGALTLVVRGMAESAGVVAWLLDDEIDAEARVRRYLVWRFADLHSLRSSIDRLADPSNPDLLAGADSELEKMEATLTGAVERSGWRCRPTASRRKPAALLCRDSSNGDRAESVPTKTTLVDSLLLPTAYSMLSQTAHSARHDVLQSIEVTGTKGDRSDIRLGASGLDINFLLRLAIHSVVHPTRLLATWNGLDITPLQRALLAAARACGTEV